MAESRCPTFLQPYLQNFSSNFTLPYVMIHSSGGFSFHFISFQPCFLVYIGCSPLSISRSAAKDLRIWNNPPIPQATQRTENFTQLPPKISLNKEFSMPIPISKSVLSSVVIGMYVQIEPWIIQKTLYCTSTR